MKTEARCSEERQAFHSFALEVLDGVEIHRLREWEAQLWPHLCEDFPDEAADVLMWLGCSCFELQPLAEFGIECGAAIGLYLCAYQAATSAGVGLDYWQARMRHAFPYLAAPIVHAEEYLKPAGDDPYHVAFWQGAHYAWALCQKQCWAGWPE